MDSEMNDQGQNKQNFDNTKLNPTAAINMNATQNSMTKNEMIK